MKETTFRKTIILLFIVITIGVVTYVGSNILVRSQLRTCEANLNTLKTGLEGYYGDRSRYPDGLNISELTLIRPPLPKDPATGKNYIYKVSEDGQKFEIKCPNPKNHRVKEIYITSDMMKAEIKY